MKTSRAPREKLDFAVTNTSGWLFVLCGWLCLRLAEENNKMVRWRLGSSSCRHLWRFRRTSNPRITFFSTLSTRKKPSRDSLFHDFYGAAREGENLFPLRSALVFVCEERNLHEHHDAEGFLRRKCFHPFLFNPFLWLHRSRVGGKIFYDSSRSLSLSLGCC